MTIEHSLEEFIEEFLDSAGLDEYGEKQVLLLLLDVYRRGRQDEAYGSPGIRFKLREDRQ